MIVEGIETAEQVERLRTLDCPHGQGFYFSKPVPVDAATALIELMNKEGYTYNIYMVPTKWNADYEIKLYCPQVEGAEWLGSFTFDKEN